MKRFLLLMATLAIMLLVIAGCSAFRGEDGKIFICVSYDTVNDVLAFMDSGRVTVL